MAYLFMQLHITIAFSVLLHPAFYLAERLVFGMYLDADTQYHHVEATIDKDEAIHVDMAEQLDDVDLSESTGRSDYYGTRNIVRYVALRAAIVMILVVVAIVLRDHFLELADFIGASAISVSCLILPSVFYLKVFGERLPRFERWLSITIACSSTTFSVYVVASIAIGLSEAPETAAVVFPFCTAGDLQMKPYYISQ